MQNFALWKFSGAQKALKNSELFKSKQKEQ